MAKEEDAYKLLTNSPSCILSLEKGLELMRESVEPMEFGIFDFYKAFSRAFGRGVMGQRGLRMDAGGFRPSAPPRNELRGIPAPSALVLRVKL